MLCGQENPITAPLCRKWVSDEESKGQGTETETVTVTEKQTEAEAETETEKQKRTRRCGGKRPVQQFIHAIVNKELFYISRARNHVDTQHALKRIRAALAVTAKISHGTMDELKERVAGMRTDANVWDTEAERVYNEIAEHTETL